MWNRAALEPTSESQMTSEFLNEKQTNKQTHTTDYFPWRWAVSSATKYTLSTFRNLSKDIKLRGGIYSQSFQTSHKGTTFLCS